MLFPTSRNYFNLWRHLHPSFSHDPGKLQSLAALERRAVRTVHSSTRLNVSQIISLFAIPYHLRSLFPCHILSEISWYKSSMRNTTKLLTDLSLRQMGNQRLMQLVEGIVNMSDFWTTASIKHMRKCDETSRN